MREKLSVIYTEDKLPRQEKRFADVSATFEKEFGQKPEHLFSAPGRSEICGNHTDHNMGKVLAAAIDLDIAAAVSKRDDNKVVIASDCFCTSCVDLSDLSVDKNIYGTSAAIVKGVAAGMKNDGFAVGGFNVYEVSDVLKGSGMSSSAAFEILIATILSYLYNDGKLDAVRAAQLSQYAENVYFGKPSGLMDQMACSVGGFVEIEFADEKNPVVTPLSFDFAATGYRLVITDCHADHADATADYAAIREDMAAVAGYFGKSCLREVDEREFMRSLEGARAACGDLPLMRAVHFFEENKRVTAAADALKAGDFEAFKRCIISSGRSSFMYLQNIYSAGSPRAQALSLALCISEKLLAPVGGAWRVHGGGFGGTIQAFVPPENTAEYIAAMEALFGQGCCYQVSVRPKGGYLVK
ncbi:MAG: galactokinase [Clostridia bacterium]|nr:galactokinase [Clostridia bacterium]